MNTHERLYAIEQHCHAYHYPPALTRACLDYLSGTGTLAQAQQEWQAAGAPQQHFYPVLAYAHTLNSASVQLDPIDFRLIDLGLMSGYAFAFFSTIGWHGPVRQAYEYLLEQGQTEEQVVQEALKGLSSLLSTSLYSTNPYLVPATGRPATLAQLLLTYLPDRFEMLRAAAQGVQNGQLMLIHLLLAAQPPLVELVWQLCQEIQEEPVSSPAALGVAAQRLLKLDPERFTPWARQIALPASNVSLQSNRLALQALLEQGIEQHLDLVVAIVHSPAPRGLYWRSLPQLLALRALYKYDPERFRPLVEEAAFSRNLLVGEEAIALLRETGVEEARPVLQRCIAGAPATTAQRALSLLLNQPWDDQLVYARTLLTHPSSAIRKQVGKWLIKNDTELIEQAAPMLNHSQAAIRLTAMQLLQQIGGEQARTMLAARLEVEPMQSLRHAILNVIGLPGDDDPAHAAQPPTVKTLTAKAERLARYLPAPVMGWLDLEQIPTLRWKNGAPVPPGVLSYLLYRQSRVKNHRELNPEVAQALELIDCNRAGNAALALFRGWLGNGAKMSERWLLPLLGPMADERLIQPMRQQIDAWAKLAKRGLAAKMIEILAQMESKAARDEVADIARLYKRIFIGKVAKEALRSAGAA